MSIVGALSEVQATKAFFDRSTSVFDESHSGFAPREGLYTVAQQVAHVARTVEWFAEGMFRPEGFSEDYETHIAEALACVSLGDARAWNDRAFAAFAALLQSKTDADLFVPLPEGAVMGGAPRIAVIGGIVDHTAHHRGALGVYARLAGLKPPMPYL